ncbi:TetR/AcrR family transcriptional regulator [Microbacterium sp. GXF7504]
MARPSARARIVEAALTASAAAGESVTLDVVARAAGVTKQGILYHFPEKRDLRAAMLDHVLARWDAEMVRILGGPLEAASVAGRIRAYARVSARGDVVPGEGVLFSEILTRPDETPRYAAWTQRWFDPGADPDLRTRARWTTAWLAANGLWSVLVTGKRRLARAEVAAVLAVVDDLTAD